MERKRPYLIVNSFIEKDGKFLAIRREGTVEVGMWEPPGGRVDPGESVEAAVIREAEEETGLKVKIKEFLGYGQGYNLPHCKGHFVSRFVLYFLCEIVSGEQKMDPKECLEHKWVTTEEFKKLDPLSEPMKNFFEKKTF